MVKGSALDLILSSARCLLCYLIAGELHCQSDGKIFFCSAAMPSVSCERLGLLPYGALPYSVISFLFEAHIFAVGSTE